MSKHDLSIAPDALRGELVRFWSDAVEIAKISDGFEFTVPHAYADGWQIVLRVSEPAPGAFRVEDKGKTLWQLAQTGQNIETDSTGRHLQAICDSRRIERDGWVLSKLCSRAELALEIHIFAEALSSISHLSFLHEPQPRLPSPSRATIEKIFGERGIEPKVNHRLAGKVEKKITVDYYARTHRQIAVQVLERRGAVVSYMEQWGFRWRDLRDAHQDLVIAMVYDPAVQNIDSTAKDIGASCCDFFGPYYETQELNQLIDRAGMLN